MVRENLRFSFPDKTQQEREQLLRAFYHHFVDIWMEVVYSYRVSQEEMRRRMVIENLDELEELCRRKKGVIVYFAHLCNWEWLADIGNQFADRSIVEYDVYRKLKSAQADRAMLLLREKRGAHGVEKNQILRHLVQLRRADHPYIIGLAADQKPAPNNSDTFTTFLHQQTAFLEGGDVLARKFDLGVGYMHVQCVERGYYRARLEFITDDAQAMPDKAITLRYVELLEANILQQPHMWLWTHNRWKWTRQ
jgi:KDO2-lipid IV(A) lauroyltransferase